MMASQSAMYPLGDITNNVAVVSSEMLARAQACYAGPSSQTLDDVGPSQRKRLSQGTCRGTKQEKARIRDDEDVQTPSSELETASESNSEWLSSEASIASDTGDDDRTIRRSSMRPWSEERQQRPRAVPTGSRLYEKSPIFFGTPSKEEIQQRKKYQASIRTRRLLRKDSIELARRKSAGSFTSGNCVDQSSFSSEPNDFYSAPMSPGRTSSPKHQAPGSSGKVGTSMPASSDEVSGLLAAIQASYIGDEHNLPAETVPYDPDETEDADWFGLSSDPPKVAASSSGDSLPSTPTRKYGVSQQENLVASVETPSEADSSPGIALASANVRHHRSPLETLRGRTSFAAFAASPLSFPPAELLMNAEHSEKENDSVHRKHNNDAKAAILKESPKKLNAAPSPWQMSPSKADLRERLAAWADSRILSPTSPDKLNRTRVNGCAESPSKSRPAQSLSAKKTDGPGQVCQVHSPAADVLPVSVAKHVNSASVRNSKLPVPMSKTGSRGKLPSSSSDSRGSKTTSSDRNKTGPASLLQGSATSHFDRKTNGWKSIAHSVVKNKTSSSSKGDARQYQKHPAISVAMQPHAKAANAASISETRVNPPTKNSRAVQHPLIRDARLMSAKRMQSSDSGDEKMVPMQSSKQSVAGSAESHPDDENIDPQFSSDGVGGARRVRMAPPEKQAPNTVASSEVRRIPQSAGPLIFRNYKPATPLQRERSAARSRPMRRIGDYVETKLSSNEGTSSSDSVPVHENVRGESAESEMYSTSSEARTFRRANPTRISRSKPETQQPAQHKLLPVSSVELSKLTSRHTRLNEMSVVEKDIVVVRRLGDLRPPSPSSRFRKDNAASSALASADKSFRAAIDELSRDHVPGAGDEEPYHSPFRRVTLKKTVRWDKNLFVGPSDAASRSAVTHSHFACEKPARSCLKARVLGLDRFGNVLPVSATTPRQLSTPAKRVRITKIVYDDDDEAQHR